jgi:hypothetical protein
MVVPLPDIVEPSYMKLSPESRRYFSDHAICPKDALLGRISQENGASRQPRPALARIVRQIGFVNAEPEWPVRVGSR